MLESETPNKNSSQESLATPPTLSVGLPVYNGAKWIVDAIESILEQSFGDFELIISDNLSTDGTEEICRDFAQRDPRVRYYRNNTNIGLYKNFDRAFELSTGKYFKWAADSDFCLDGFFEKCVAILDTRPDVVLTYTKAYLLMLDWNGEEVTTEYFDDFNLEDERPSERFIKYLNREKINNVMHGVIRADALRKTNLILPMGGSDISMVAELSLLGKFVETEERLFVRRFDAETSSMLMDKATAVKKDVPIGGVLKNKVVLHCHRFVSVFKAPINTFEKLRLWLYLSRREMSAFYHMLRKIIRLAIPGR